MAKMVRPLGIDEIERVSGGHGGLEMVPVVQDDLLSRAQEIDDVIWMGGVDQRVGDQAGSSMPDPSTDTMPFEGPNETAQDRRHSHRWRPLRPRPEELSSL
ncbi:MAG TPA: hypothetical protein VED40_02565 [Azospirillaceae bacterium]|nr:hypothetical protein [Azospirillaceae bacterium]